MTKSAPTFTILHGDDDLRIEEEVARLRTQMGTSPDAQMNTAEYDGAATDANEVLNTASTYPMFYDKRLVIVKNMLSWITRKGAGNTGKKAVETLVDGLPGLPDWTRLIFVEREKLADTHKVVQLAKANPNGFEKAFLAPKDPTAWIVKRAQDSYGATIETRAAAALASVIQGDLRRADNELVKLVSYVGETRPITEQDVALLTPYVAEASMFEMVDALAEGRGKAAMTTIRRLLDQGEDVFSLYGMIVRQFRLLLLAKEHLVTGGYPATIADAIGVHKFVAEKLAKQSRSFSLSDLEQIYTRLQEYDLQMKTGRIEPELAVEMLIANLAR